MENLGDWLYIVILAVAGISGLLSAGRKKKHQEEIPGEIFTEEEPVENRHQPMQSPERNKRVKKRKPTPQPSPFLSSERDLKSAIQPTLVETEEEKPPIVSADSFSDADEIKRAILYSEIFNRKY
ncbi:MAG: hypothetical protein LBQ39_09525 [Tannerellaceae bacterium]|jgi:hypothetical protein|nr:hypothetical protein [Tannerellaceae bacterium]